jgi:hypothetical protein
VRPFRRSASLPDRFSKEQIITARVRAVGSPRPGSTSRLLKNSEASVA